MRLIEIFIDRTHAAPSSRIKFEGPFVTKHVLMLFVADRTPLAVAAIANAQQIVGRAEFADRFELSVIDVLECADQAEEARVVATPTLVKNSPLPKKRVIGDLSDTEMVIANLGLGVADTGNGR